MPVSVQVLYPTAGGTTFDHDYYETKHAAILDEHLGTYLAGRTVTKIAPGEDGTIAFHAIATLVFADAKTRDAALGVAGPVLADIGNFTNAAPQMLMGDVTG